MAENPLQPVQVRREQFEHKSMDYSFLKEEGLRLVQLLSGSIWTDYNEHDPGVTILEQLCFALTDLGYRTDFKIQDLLNARSRQARREINNTFYDGSEALPSNPVSLEDYRVLFIDRVQFVRNAWIEVVRDNLLGIKGLYRIHLQVDEAARTPQLIEQIKEGVYRVFCQHRNLGEDIDSIHILDVEPIVLHAELDVSPDAITEEILANILFKIEEHLNPTIQFHTLEDMLEEGYAVDEIFEGPAPIHGFIKRDDLLPVRREIYVSKLIELISNTPGVRRINYIRVEKDGFPIEGDVIRIEEGCYPVLDMDPISDKYADANRYPIKCYRGSIGADLDLNTTNQLYASMYARYRKGYELELLYHERDYPSVLKQEEIQNYYSIQNFFPITYGLNRFGLPSNVRASRERTIMIKQLKGYLLFFEQILANYLAQLSNIKQLFSINEDMDKTYFSQVPLDIPGLESLVPGGGGGKYELFQKKLEEIVKEFDPFIDRRNRFLDHLLARFGEQTFTQFKHNHQDDSDKAIISTKIAMLRHWMDVSRNRGKGFDYMDADWSGWNASGLEKRICLMFNIQQRSAHSLLLPFFEQNEETGWQPFDAWIKVLASNTQEGRLDLERLEQVEQQRAAEALQRNQQQQIDDQQDIFNEMGLDLPGMDTPDKPETPIYAALPDETESLDYTQQLLFRSDNRTELLQDLFANAIFSHNYIVIPNRKGTISLYYKGNRDLGAYKVWEGAGYVEVHQKLESWINYLSALNRRMEGFHLVEHILLRAQAKDRHGFRFINDQDNVLLVSYELGDLEEQRAISNQIDEFGLLRDHYKIVEQLNQNFQIILVNQDQKPIAVCPEPIYTREGAEEKIEDLIEHFQSFQDSRVPITNYINFFMEQRKDSNVGQQFFSLHLSVVAPNFLTRFQAEDFRTLLAHFFAIHAPVHLHLDFHWLSFEEMERFEQRYFDWTKARASYQPQQPELDDKATELVRLLAQYQQKVG